MHTEDSQDASADEQGAPARTGALRLVASNDISGAEPRRRLVAGCLAERRATDRRRAKPGLDGLLRTVLADDWKPRALKAAPVWGKLAAPPQHGADEIKHPRS